ncbi:lysylphosphatidylglycerol synthase domain-containing protein [Streptomyces sp. NPDC090306]|uniref:lysylphosphatidylglycerol synthase domain-containing protein n=1 Tax=Streptomyces sp. NPDC090306 TaxID=3365961 RepID=UPI003822F62A
MTTPSGITAATAGSRRRVYWQTGFTLLVLTAFAVLARRHWPVLQSGAGRLVVADPGWLLVGAVAAAGTWLCSALAQQGAVTERLPGGRLLAAQFAASAANHLLPAGLGAGVVNVRFLMRQGLGCARSATAVAVKGTAGGAVRAVLIALLALACPGLLRVPPGPLVPIAGVLGVAALVTVLVVAGRRPRCGRVLAAAVADVRAVHARPARAAALWGGSLAFATLHSLVMIAVTQAVGLRLPPLTVALLYLAASSAAALLPTPGGIGSLDAALALALTAAGAPAATAASAVLGYRLLTVWLPLVPGLVLLAVMVRRKSL